MQGKCIKPNDGDWVILRGDDIVECDPDIKKILEIAKKYNDNEIVVSKMPSAEYCFY